MTEKTYSIEELASLTGLTVRTIRYYIQMGIADRPEGSRRGAWYGDKHLEQLMRIRSLTSQGLSLEAIKRRLDPKATEGSGLPPKNDGPVRLCLHFEIAPGVALVADRDRSGLTATDLRRLAEATGLALRNIREGTRGNFGTEEEKEQK